MQNHSETHPLQYSQDTLEKKVLSSLEVPVYQYTFIDRWFLCIIRCHVGLKYAYNVFNR